MEAADCDRSIRRGSLGIEVPSVNEVSLMLVHRPYGSSCSTPTFSAPALVLVIRFGFMATNCSLCAVSSSVGGANPLCRLKLFHCGLFSLCRFTLSRLVDFLCCCTSFSAYCCVCWPGGLVELVVLEESGRPESKLLLLRASWK